MKPFVLTLASCPTEWGDGCHVGAGMPMAAFIRLHWMPMAAAPWNHGMQGTTPTDLSGATWVAHVEFGWVREKNTGAIRAPRY